MLTISKVTLLKLKTEKDLATLRGKPRALAGLLAVYRTKTETISKDKRLSDDYRKRLLEEAKAVFKAQLDQHKAESTEAAARLAGTLEEARHENVDVNQALLYEIQSQKYWDRARLLLDSGMTPLQVLERYQGSLETLKVLKTELPDYIAAKSKGNDPGLSQGLDTLIDKYSFPLLPEHQQQAKLLEAEFKDGSYQLDLTQTYLEFELEGKTKNELLPAWEKGKVISVQVQPEPVEAI